MSFTNDPLLENGAVLYVGVSHPPFVTMFWLAYDEESLGWAALLPPALPDGITSLMAEPMPMASKIGTKEFI